MRQRDRTDWAAVLIMLVIGAALLYALVAIGRGMPLPFVKH